MKKLIEEVGNSGELDTEKITRALKKSIQRMEHLGRMVNDYAGQLGLGTKVHIEDWTDLAQEALEAVAGKEKPLKLGNKMRSVDMEGPEQGKGE